MVILAVESIILITVLIGVILYAWKLVGLAKQKFVVFTDDASDLADTGKEMAKDVAGAVKHGKGTFEFMADRTAKPVIELYSAVAGASRFAQAFFRPNKDRPNDNRPSGS